MANQPVEFKRILVADDFTPHGSAALQAAAEIAKVFGAKLDVAHVVTNVVESPAHAVDQACGASSSAARRSGLSGTAPLPSG